MLEFRWPKPLPTPPEAAIHDFGEGVEAAELRIRQLLEQRRTVELELELLDQKIKFVARSTCGPKNDLQDVEDYDGSLGVSKQFVAEYETPVGQLQWFDDLPKRFSGRNDHPGTVNDRRWGTGALISPELFLTAGHCFDRTGNGWIRPSRNGVTISPQEMATLMRVNFNFQVIGSSGGQLRPGNPFPVIALREYCVGGVDYAVVELGRNAANQLPGDVYHWLTAATTDLRTPGVMLCIIQHPDQKPKMVGAGHLLDNVDGTISYEDIDTDDGSSGAPILSSSGQIVGVHVEGGCTPMPGGANAGVAIGWIRKVSKLIP